MQLGTREVAELLGVHSSTVKRWFRGVRGSGESSAARSEPASAGARVGTTAGGHRRIPLDTALRVARERGNEVYLHWFGDDAGAVWTAVQALENGNASPARNLLVGWLRLRRAHLIRRFLRHVTASDPVEARILDGVLGGFMRRVGEGWQRGELRIADERAATREVSETILSLVGGRGHAGGLRGPQPPVAVVGTLENDHHALGALMVRLLLVQRGWAVEYLGTGLPIPEIVAAQRAHGAALVCLSVTPPSGIADVHRFIEVARELADPRRPFALAVGGGGSRRAGSAVRAWPLGRSGRFASLSVFRRWMDRHFPRTAPISA
ncbi:MAG: cobalamin B12-binding domain-containing protein [Gammaproteobacteria bacterium]|nr:cobalamin B12-binding domain-containing protein [Gammaproteobacteria bacterium]MYD00072.1 cobalamin B12-binding domain-containing protein [Gammaproteobacteria bacterium]